MGFHITQPGSSVATSLIDGESKPKHVLLVEIKVVPTNPALEKRYQFFIYLFGLQWLYNIYTGKSISANQDTITFCKAL